MRVYCTPVPRDWCPVLSVREFLHLALMIRLSLKTALAGQATIVPAATVALLVLLALWTSFGLTL